MKGGVEGCVEKRHESGLAASKCRRIQWSWGFGGGVSEQIQELLTDGLVSGRVHFEVVVVNGDQKLMGNFVKNYFNGPKKWSFA